MKKLLIALTIMLVSGTAYWVYSRNGKSNTPVYVPVTAVRGEISDVVDTTGHIEPLNRVAVKPAVAGRVDKLLVEEGDTVKSGQVLAYLSSTDRVAILDAARAKGEDVLDKWEKTYNPTPVLSPLDGTVIKRGVVKGETLDTATEMFALADNLIVIAQVDEADIGRIKKGQRAVFTLDAYPKETFQGAVFQILREGVSVSNVITYSVKIRPDRVPGSFVSEMSANIKIIITRKQKAVLLPAAALTETEDGMRCVYKGAPQSPVLTQVKTGLDDGTNVEILDGAQEGETVFYTADGYVPPLTETDSANPLMPSGPVQSPGGPGGPGGNPGPPPAGG